jgi:hypothetical protein
VHARTKRRPVAPVKSLAGTLAPVNGKLLAYDDRVDVYGLA